MWHLAGAAIVLGGLAPSAALWLLGDGDASLDDLGSAAATHCVVDVCFLLSAAAFLWLANRYLTSRTAGAPPRRRQLPPYPGAWVEADGTYQPPHGFPAYLALVCGACLVAPCAALLAAWARGASDAALAAAALGPYLLLLVPQVLLEVRVSALWVTPVISLLFAHYRVWQLLRALQLVRGAGGAAHWLVPCLVALLAAWVFNTAATLAWLPEMYMVQLQDRSKLQRVCRARQRSNASSSKRGRPERVAAELR